MFDAIFGRSVKILKLLAKVQCVLAFVLASMLCGAVHEMLKPINQFSAIVLGLVVAVVFWVLQMFLAWALYAFAVKNTIAFLAIIAAAVLRLTPWTVLLTLLIIPFVVKQTKLLFNKQVKKETFPAAIRILLIGSLVQVVTFAVGLI